MCSRILLSLGLTVIDHYLILFDSVTKIRIEAVIRQKINLFMKSLGKINLKASEPEQRMVFFHPG